MRHARELEDSVILLRPIAVRDAVASLTVKAFHLAVVEVASSNGTCLTSLVAALELDVESHECVWRVRLMVG